MNRFSAILIGLICLGVGASCAKTNGPAAGTNTNWLKLCTESADCKGDGDCLCGVCTLSCSDQDACSALGAPAQCMEASKDRCGRGVSGSVCLPVTRVTPVDAGPVDAGSSDDAGLKLLRDGDTLVVTDRYRPCGVDDDCILVGTSCSGCCDQDAIRAHDRDAYRTNSELACSGYQGPICDCQPLDLVPICRDGLCAAVPREPPACYSPANVDRAYESGARGCDCPDAGLEICVGGTALVCWRGSSGLAWTVAEDGPCGAREGNMECRPVQQRASASACLAEFSSCVELPSGMFCGSDCHGPLDCDAIDCDYKPYTMGCSSGFIHEGQCGDIRYRRASAIGSSTWYWNAAGQLVALVETSDVGDYCGGGDNVLRRGDLDVVQGCEVVIDDTTSLCD